MPSPYVLRIESYCTYLLCKLLLSGITEVYVYGTGDHAKILLRYFKEVGIAVIGMIDDGFGEIHYNDFLLPIFKTSEIEHLPKVIVIASLDHQEVIYKRLNSKKMSETIILKAFEMSEIPLPEAAENPIVNKSHTALFIGDNTDTLNYGCQATSLALIDIISKSVQISDKLYREEILGLFSSVPLYSDLRQYISEVKANNEDVWDSLISRIDQVDVVVLNAEGSFIFQAPPRPDMYNYAAILSICVEAGKPFYILNAMFSNFAEEPLNTDLLHQCLPILESARLVSARDPYSKKLITSHSRKVNIKYIPDALFSRYGFYIENAFAFKQAMSITIQDASTEETPPPPETIFEAAQNAGYILLSGNSFAAHYQEQAEVCFTRLAKLLRDLSEKYRYKLYLIECCDGDRFLRSVSAKTGIPFIPVKTDVYLAGFILGRAVCFVSGRYHPAILASLGGTPCIYMGSNSHKTTSLQEVLGIPMGERETYKALPDEKEAKRVTSAVEAILTSNRQGEKRAQIQKACARNMRSAEQIKDVFCMETV